MNYEKIIPRIGRLLFGALVPVPLGVLIANYAYLHRFGRFLFLYTEDFFFYFVMWYYFFGVQSILFSIVHEYILLQCKTIFHMIGGIVWGAAIGLFSGFLFIGFGKVFMAWGFIVGVIVSCLLILIHVKTDFKRLKRSKTYIHIDY